MTYSLSIPTRSFYIHWPFCPYRCHFCPFVALAGQDHLMEHYHRALIQEITLFGASLSDKHALDTIFIGGGTPSTYPPHLLRDLFATLKNVGILHENTEVTLEVNPGTVTDEKIETWSAVGINRLSIGVQSLKDSVLKNLNRHQSIEDVYSALNRVQGLFSHVSIDLILGLPGVSDDEWRSLINTVVAWPITHTSIYFLTVHEQTQLYFRVQKGEVALPCDDAVVDLYYWSRDTLSKHGLQQYEISSFAREGHRCRHNSVYWERKPYKGFGLGAHSFDGKARYQNEKNIMKYMAAITGNHNPTVVAETLSREQVHKERVMLGLRKVQGIPFNELVADLLPHEKEQLTARVAGLIEQGWLCQENGWLKLTPKGLSVEHHIALQVSC